MLFVCGGLRQNTFGGRGLGFLSLDVVRKYGICVVKYVGLRNPKLALYML